MEEILDNITLVIVDDHELARLGIRQILEQVQDIEIVGEARNGDEAIVMVERLRPKVLLLDIQMPGMPSREVERLVRDRYPEVVTLILTAHDRDSYLSDFMEAGVAGFLDKNTQGNKLIAAIRRAASGEHLFTTNQIKRVQKWKVTVGEKWKGLTPREKEVATHIARGLNNKEIADNLSISSRTVSFHIENILRKLNTETRQQAIAWINKNILGNDL